MFHVPSALDKFHSEPVKELGMTGALALRAEFLRGFDEADSENHLPETVDHHPRREWMPRLGQPPSQRQSVGSKPVRQLSKRRRHSGRNLFPQRAIVSADKNMSRSYLRPIRHHAQLGNRAHQFIPSLLRRRQLRFEFRLCRPLGSGRCHRLLERFHLPRQHGHGRFLLGRRRRHDRSDMQRALKDVFRHLIEECEQLVVLARREWIVFMIMTFSALHRDSEPRRSRRIDAVHGVFGGIFLSVRPSFRTSGSVAVESAGHPLFNGRIWQ